MTTERKLLADVPLARLPDCQQERLVTVQSLPVSLLEVLRELALQVVEEEQELVEQADATSGADTAKRTRTG
jgi:hypothetical protein